MQMKVAGVDRVEALPGRIRGWLGSVRLPWMLALVVLLLGSPALPTGFQVDDLLHRVILLGRRDVVSFAPDRPHDLFVFGHGNVEANARILDSGIAPWWSLPGIQLAFARPVTVLTHMLDYRLWPDIPAMMHLHNLLWYAVVVVLAALLLGGIGGETQAGWTAGLAAWFFAVDEAHALPAAWIANRNALVAAAFGFGALLLHDRWRREGSRICGVGAPALLALAVGGGEAAVAAGGYLVAYALFIDKGPLARRLAALIPCAVVGVAWMVLYRWNGYGAYGSMAYIDPGRQPMEYLRAFPTRAAALLAGEWSGPPPELAVFVALWMVPFLTALNLLFLGVIAAVLWPLRRDPVSRFYGAGMLFALVPVCATFPSGRLLIWVGLGAAGLMGRFFAARAGDAKEFCGSWRRVPARWLAGFLVIVHGVIAAAAFPVATQSLRAFGSLLDRADRSFPDVAGMEEKTVIAVNLPTCMMMSYIPTMRALEGRAFAARYRAFGPSSYPMTLARRDERTLIVTPGRGFMPPAGTPDPARPGVRPPAFDPAHIACMMDQLVRDARTHPFRAGDRIELTGLSIEVTRVNAEGRPLEAGFAFDRPLEDPSMLWLRWSDEGFEPFTPPPVGASVTLPAVRMRF